MRWVLAGICILAAGVVLSFCFFAIRNVDESTDQLRTLYMQLQPRYQKIQTLCNLINKMQNTYRKMYNNPDGMFDQRWTLLKGYMQDCRLQLDALIADQTEDAALLEEVKLAVCTLQQQIHAELERGNVYLLDGQNHISSLNDNLMKKLEALERESSLAIDKALESNAHYAKQNINNNMGLVLIMSVLMVFIVGLMAFLFWNTAKCSYQDGLIRRMAMSSIDEGFFVVNPQQEKVEYISERVETILGVPSSVDHRGYLQWREYCRASAIENTDIEKLLAAHEEESAELDVSAGEEGRWIGLHFYPLTWPSGQMRYVVKVADQTRRHIDREKLADTLRDAIAATKQTAEQLSSLCHEVRTPLNGVLAFARQAKRCSGQPEKQLQAISNIESSADYLLRLTKEMLLSEKIRQGDMELVKEEFLPGALIRDVANLMVVQVKAKDQKLIVNVNGISGYCAWGDPLRCQQILFNLLSNAVKFAPAGGIIQLTAELTPTQDGNLHFAFSVQDNGIGMSESFLEKLFLPFTQEGDAYTQAQGTGLGMSITKTLVEQMGGSISVESKLGEGTTFYVELHLALGALVPIPQLGVSPRVLLLDDDVLRAGHTLRKLIVMGAAATGVGAQEQLQVELSQRRYDVCILCGRACQSPQRVIELLHEQDVKAVYVPQAWAQELEGADAYLDSALLYADVYAALCKVLGIKGEQAPAEKITQDMVGRHILVADDNAASRDILCDLLALRGAAAQGMPDGTKLLEAYCRSEQDEIDAVLLDLHMPGELSSWQTALAIRASHRRDARRLPIIGVTAGASQEECARAMRSGMNACVIKPVEMKELCKLLMDLWNEGEEDGRKICG
ncbi:MAG: ATP-binding protein [Eubacteriales bacterium]|nr:ATP-binding protein [Eubacteriales bacterium]